MHSIGVLLMLALLSGCASNEIKWTEEVKLHDGSVVLVKRRTELTESGFPVQKRGFHKYHELCFVPLGAYWRSKPEYRPQAFDIVDGKAYIKVPVRGCAECMLQGYPDDDALYFVWDKGTWSRAALNDTLRQLQFNLLESTHAINNDSHDAHGLVTLAEKEKRDAGIYFQMKATARSAPYVLGACARCKGVRVQTDRTPDVFLASLDRSCSW